MNIDIVASLYVMLREENFKAYDNRTQAPKNFRIAQKSANITKSWKLDIIQSSDICTAKESAYTLPGWHPQSRHLNPASLFLIPSPNSQKMHHNSWNLGYKYENWCIFYSIKTVSFSNINLRYWNTSDEKYLHFHFACLSHFILGGGIIWDEEAGRKGRNWDSLFVRDFVVAGLWNVPPLWPCCPRFVSSPNCRNCRLVDLLHNVHLILEDPGPRKAISSMIEIHIWIL